MQSALHCRALPLQRGARRHTTVLLDGRVVCVLSTCLTTASRNAWPGCWPGPGRRSTAAAQHLRTNTVNAVHGQRAGLGRAPAHLHRISSAVWPPSRSEWCCCCSSGRPRTIGGSAAGEGAKLEQDNCKATPRLALGRGNVCALKAGNHPDAVPQHTIPAVLRAAVAVVILSRRIVVGGGGGGRGRRRPLGLRPATRDGCVSVPATSVRSCVLFVWQCHCHCDSPWRH